MAAKQRRELGGAEVEMQRGPYREFNVLVDGETAVDGGSLAALGVLPSVRRVVTAVRDRLNRET